MKQVALIPAYKPDSALINIVNELTESNYKVVVVDDGSGIEYKSIFDELINKATVISYGDNRGKGYALKTGLTYIKNNEEDIKNEENIIIVTMDADGQHQVSDASRLCIEAAKDNADLIIGSRIIPRDAPIKSRLGNGITRLVYKFVAGVSIYDTQSGLRAFKREMIPFMLEISGNRYEYEMNVLLAMAKQKRLMKEIPIETIYFDKQNSVSHFDALRDSIKIYGQILKFAGSSIISFFVDYTLYSIILIILGVNYVLLANICARAVSSIANFILNKRIVFQSDNAMVKDGLKYFSLVVIILSLNSLFLKLLTRQGMNVYFAKIFVECLMFFVSYGIQRNLIFKKE